MGLPLDRYAREAAEITGTPLPVNLDTVNGHVSLTRAEARTYVLAGAIDRDSHLTLDEAAVANAVVTLMRRVPDVLT